MRCDWCGKPISLLDGDVLLSAYGEDFAGDDNVEVDEVIEAFARALKTMGPKNAMLAESLREDRGYKLHKECFGESGYAEMEHDG